jgi:ABC-type dipeptide/oligopeptide/nickel transport system permease component
MVFFWILGVIIWVAMAFWPASVASRKGHSFLGYFLLSVPFWWITLFIAYFGLKDNSSPAASHAEA